MAKVLMGGPNNILRKKQLISVGQLIMSIPILFLGNQNCQYYKGKVNSPTQKEET